MGADPSLPWRCQEDSGAAWWVGILCPSLAKLCDFRQVIELLCALFFSSVK